MEPRRSAQIKAAAAAESAVLLAPAKKQRIDSTPNDFFVYEFQR